MSAAAMKWLARQSIADRTLADAADKAGRAALRQEEIASRTRLTARTVRSNLNLLEHFRAIHRETQRSPRAGRAADLITLALDRDHNLPRDQILEARRSGCPNAVYRKRGAGCPIDNYRNAVPVGEAAPSSSKIEGLYIARAHAFNVNAADVEKLKNASARSWEEGGEWRARLTYEGLTLDLGRHESQDLAEAECRVRLLDIAFSLRTKAGTPREPEEHMGLEWISGRELAALLDDELAPERTRTADETFDAWVSSA